MTVGENGILTRAREAKNIYTNAQEKEQARLNALAEQLANVEIGNLWEWTQEASYINNTLESYVHCGGCFSDSYSDRPACYRDCYIAIGACNCQ